MAQRVLLAAAALLLAMAPFVQAGCPFGFDKQGAARANEAVAASSDASLSHRRSLKQTDMWTMQEAASAIDYHAVAADIKKMLTVSQDFWPADWAELPTGPNYGPFLIRQAWHCSGSYRGSDGRGGCDGGRQRFDPELSWADNTNLDKAKTLLQPIKIKYGPGLSWGDLIVLAGNVAIESMGGPILGFCAGRIDDVDGTASLELGRSPEQEEIAPCPVQGQCKWPLGPSFIVDIYVDPAGYMGIPDPGPATSGDIRDVFGRMNFNDTETVALVGGGHAFGKTHGACIGDVVPGTDTNPVGDHFPYPRQGHPPNVDPFNPWKGNCGLGPNRGKGNNTFTSGFEGPWTSQPTTWTNSYFKNLLRFNWTLITGPGGNWQWKPEQLPGGPAPPSSHIMMLTTDVANIHDPEYRKIVELYAANITTLEKDFAAAWYKLTTQDMGPATRCLGNMVPPPQPFQDPLPPTPKKLADFKKVRNQILKVLYTDMSHVLEPDTLPDGTPYYGALFVNLAWRCASTFRATDYRGGCNGARIRFSPEKDWPVNVAMDKVMEVLRTVKDKFPPSKGALSWADLIVLAGQTALEEAGAPKMKFCGGRVDATEGAYYAYRDWYPNPFVAARDNMKVMGLTNYEAIALAGRIVSPTQQMRLGYNGTWTKDPSVLSNKYYKTLLDNDWPGWATHKGPDMTNGTWVYTNQVVTDGMVMTSDDLVIKYNTTWRAVAQEYAGDNHFFLKQFSAAWTRLMNADRFDGPLGNVCGEGMGISGVVTKAAINPLVIG